MKADLASYRHARDEDGSWVISSPDGPDLRITAAQNDVYALQAPVWTFLPFWSDGTERLEAEWRVIATFEIPPAQAGIAPSAGTIIEAINAILTPGKIATRRGNVERMNRLLQDVADFQGIPLYILSMTNEEAAKAGCGPRIMSDIVQWFGPAGGHPTEQVGMGYCRHFALDRRQQITADFDPAANLTWHDRMEAAMRLEAFYAEARADLGLDGAMIAARIREATTKHL